MSLNFRKGNHNDSTNLALVFDSAGRRVPAYFWFQYAASGQSFFEFGREKIRTIIVKTVVTFTPVDCKLSSNFLD